MIRFLVALVLMGALSACSSAPTSGPSPAAVTPSCEGPPTIVFGENGTPIPILLTCERAVAAALARLPAAVGEPVGGGITSIQFHYGRYCPPGWRCGPFFGDGEAGFVLFGLRDGGSWLANVRASSSGAVTVTDIVPTPTHPAVVPDGT